MAFRDLFKSAPPAGSKPEQSAEVQVDYSYTQWRYAQMLQLERNYLAACDSVDGAVVA